MNNLLKTPFFLWLAILLSSLSAFIIPLFKFKHQFISRDWTLYNCFSYFNQSSYLHYKTIPIHNPYVLGGIDLFASPQSKAFSPLSIFDLFLSAPYASLLSIITLSIIGSYGMYKLLIYLKIKPTIAFLAMVLYAHASWFSLHFTEGHVIFGSFQLMSLVLYFTLRLVDIKYKMYLAVLLAFMILDGGMYAFIYSIILIVFSFLFRLNRISLIPFLISIKKDFFLSVIAMFIFIGLSSAKLIPFLSLHKNRVPILENIQLDLSAIFQVFFNPFQHLYLKIPHLVEDYNIGFHEIGAYIGVFSLLIIVLFLTKNYQKKFSPYLLFILFFFWMGTGLGGEFNPWKIFQKIPLINNAHIQTRGLFLVYFVLIILLSYALHFYSKKLNKIWFFTIVFLLIFESLFVSNYSFYKIFQRESSLSTSTVFENYIKNTTVEKTIPSPGDGWGRDFQLFEQKNIASKGFLDNAVVQGDIKTINDEDYKGEVYFSQGEGSLNVLSYTPNGLEVEINTESAAEIQFNTNYLLRWESSNKNIQVFEKNGLLTIKTKKLNQKITLKYRPKYLFVIFPLYIIAIILFLAFILYNKYKGRRAI